MENLFDSAGPMGQLLPSATLAITSKAKAMKAAGEDVCSLSAGEPDFDTPENIKQAAIEAIQGGQTKYTPATGLPQLKEIIAKKFKDENGIDTSAAQVVVAPGAKFSVFSAIAALCGAGDEVIIAAPYWVSYPEMIEACGATVKVINCTADNNYEIAPEELEATVNDKTKLLILNTPSNPTGAVYRKATLEAIAKIAVDKNFLILSDEIYEKLVYDTDAPHISIASLSKEVNDLTITVNGLSKAYAMTGWRLGYLTAPLVLTKKISSLQSHTTSNPTTFAQFGAIEAIAGDQSEVEKMRQQFSVRRDLIFKIISDIPGVECIRPTGAFYIFCDVSSFGLTSQDFCAGLLEKFQVAVIPGEPFGAPGNIRLSYACSEEQIIKATDRLREYCASL